MNRRKFLGVCAGAAVAVPVLAKSEVLAKSDTEWAEGYIKGVKAHKTNHYRRVVEGIWFTETYRGEEMQFERWYDSFGKDNLIYSVRSRFVNPKTGLKTVFAIGKMQTREMFEDGDDMSPYIENLRYAMKLTIDIIKAGRVLPNDARALFPAPIKPEGSPVMLI